jgi:hypothetical protein
MEQRYLKMAGLCLVLLLIVGALAVALQAQARATRAQTQSQASCQFYRDIATAKIPDKTTSLGLTILADSRIAYITGDCVQKLGPLTASDQRLWPYLPKSMR